MTTRIHGDSGNDRIEGGAGNDIINGGAGDDIITDLGGDDNIKGGDGNDAINAGQGLDLVLGGAGKDFIMAGPTTGRRSSAAPATTSSSAPGRPSASSATKATTGSRSAPSTARPATTSTRSSRDDMILGHDVFLGDGSTDEFIGEGGDDILVGSAGSTSSRACPASTGRPTRTPTAGVTGVHADLTLNAFDEFPLPPPLSALDQFGNVEGLSGSAFNDLLCGSEVDATEHRQQTGRQRGGILGSMLDADGIALIDGLQDLLGATAVDRRLRRRRHHPRR